ncbi:metallophosphatase [Chloropicon primus]|nr:metallophosphatase [Chloropicon primus]
MRGGYVWNRTRARVGVVLLVCVLLALGHTRANAVRTNKRHSHTTTLSTSSTSPGGGPSLVRLAFAGSDEVGQPTGVSVSWSTGPKPKDLKSVVLLGTEQGNLTLRVESTAPGSQVTYLAGGTTHHHVEVTGLEPDTTYYYRCGDDSSGDDSSMLSEEHSFRTAPDVRAGAKGFTVAVWGDMGAGNCSQKTREMMQALSPSVDFAWHLGDIAYQDDWLFLDFAYEKVLDEYMASMEFFSATRAYMTLAGNHECDCHSIRCILDSELRNSLHNFTAYNARYRMPSKESGGIMNMWYSFNYGPVHFVNLDSETDYYGAAEGEHDEFYLLDSGHFNPYPNAYMEWLEEDLKQANSVANRTLRPWVIAGTHRPMYLYGNASSMREAVEDLLIKYDVDLFLGGHIHSYFRTYPAKAGEAVKDYSPEARAGKLVNIITGTPGAIDRPMRGGGVLARAGDWVASVLSKAGRAAYERVVPWLTGGPRHDPRRDAEALEDDMSIVAHHTHEQSFGMLHILNDSAIRWELVSSETGESIDRLELTK